MWHVEKKLMTLYRSSLEPSETQVDIWTSQISVALYREQLITKKPEFPFSIEKLEHFYEILKSKKYLLFIKKKLADIFTGEPAQYEEFLKGGQLQPHINSKITDHIEKYGAIASEQYASLRGIRKKENSHFNIHQFENIDSIYGKTFSNFMRYERMYTSIKDNESVYQQTIEKKRIRKLDQEKARETAPKRADSEDDIAELQESLGELGLL